MFGDVGTANLDNHLHPIRDMERDDVARYQSSTSFRDLIVVEIVVAVGESDVDGVGTAPVRSG